jgi:hypothetical protein
VWCSSKLPSLNSTGSPPVALFSSVSCWGEAAPEFGSLFKPSLGGAFASDCLSALGGSTSDTFEICLVSSFSFPLPAGVPGCASPEEVAVLAAGQPD